MTKKIKNDERINIDYGIDLGTTNSVIVRMERGVPRIIKSDTLKDTVPSCVHFNRRQHILAGDPAVNSMKSDIFMKNSYIEFKRTMGTVHTYYSTHMTRSFTSEELSAELLKKMKSIVLDEDNISAIVITVPAKFLAPQNDATIKAAELAGFKQTILLQEPIAAAMAYGLYSEKKDGYWLVFDFGGGTFDAALVKAEKGCLSVKDTAGNNWLGGKNLDYAIVDKILIPQLERNYDIEKILENPNDREILRWYLKRRAEEGRIQISFKDQHDIQTDLGEIPLKDANGEELDVDITITQKDMARILSPLFQEAIDIANDLLKRNNLRGADLDALIPVGGPTHSPILRRMLKEQITEKVDTSEDPMTVVAQGAAIFASTIKNTVADKKTEHDILYLDLDYASTSVLETETISIKIAREKTAGTFPSEMFVDIKRAGGAWSSGMKRLNNDKATIINLLLEKEHVSSFEIQVFDDEGNRITKISPNHFEIVPIVPPSPPLPYNIGIAKYFEDKNADLFYPVKGLEKNKSLPATGVINGLKTRQAIKHGNSESGIRVPIYQGDYNAEGTDPALNNLIYEVIITGKTFPKDLPEGSVVDITIKIDQSQTMLFSAYFPSMDHTEELPIEIKQTMTPVVIDLGKQIAEVKKKAIELNAYDIINRLSELEKQMEYEKGSADGMLRIQNELRKLLLELAREQSKNDWPNKVTEMKNYCRELNKLVRQAEIDPAVYCNLDNDKMSAAQYSERAEKIIEYQNIGEANKFIADIKNTYFEIANKITGGIMYVYIFDYYKKNFNLKHWTKPVEARLLIEEGEVLRKSGRYLKLREPVMLEPFKTNTETDYAWIEGEVSNLLKNLIKLQELCPEDERIPIISTLG